MADQQNLDKLVNQNADLRDIYGLLARTNTLPTTRTAPIPEGDMAQFNPNVGQTGQVTFNPDYPVDPRTASHEYTHALDYTMGDIWARIHQKLQQDPNSVTPQEHAFYQGYQKLIPSDTHLTRHIGDPYRSQSPELRAFGIGNMAVPGSTQYAIPHTDATMAQEAAILRDLFRRSLK